MKQTTQEQKPLIKWLKRIFSLNTLLFLLTAIGSYYGYKSYQNSRNGEIGIFLQGDETSVDVSDQRYFYIFGHSSCFSPSLIYPQYDIHIPVLKNVSNKSINNLYIKIEVSSFNCDFPEEISPFYKKTGDVLDISYCNEIQQLRPYEELPFISDVIELTHKNLRSSGATMILDYTITYDGIKEPMHLRNEITMRNIDDEIDYEKVPTSHYSTEEYRELIMERYNKYDYMVDRRQFLYFTEPLIEDFFEETKEKEDLSKCAIILGDTVLTNLRNLNLLQEDYYNLEQVGKIKVLL